MLILKAFPEHLHVFFSKSGFRGVKRLLPAPLPPPYQKPTKTLPQNLCYNFITISNVHLQIQGQSRYIIRKPFYTFLQFLRIPAQKILQANYNHTYIYVKMAH